MRSSFLGLLAIAASSVQAKVLYSSSIPQSLQLRIAAAECVLPDDFVIADFAARSADKGVTLNSFDFTFHDDSTLLETQCHFNETSVAIEIPGRTKRWSCDDPNVQFVWQDNALTMIERVCPGTDGDAQYEASGSVVDLELTCEDDASIQCVDELAAAAAAESICRTAEEDIASRFYSLNPVPASLTNTTRLVSR